jgi:hypothetical protein
LEPTKKSSAYLRGYASGFFAISASFRLNDQMLTTEPFFTTLLGEWTS